MSEDELKEYYNIFTDCWKLFRNHNNARHDDEYWKLLVKDSHKLSERYSSTLAKDIIVAAISELERIEKKGCEVQ